jgi:pyruvate dehydrogenase (quinone)
VRHEEAAALAATADAEGFSLCAIRTILAGRGDELLDLVSTNVARRLLD